MAAGRISSRMEENMRITTKTITTLQSRFRILRYDTRGHGGSDVPDGPYRLDDLVADAVALMDALAIRQVHFVGLSMGGMIGQGIALAYPDRLLSLSLCSTSARIPPEAQPVVQERIDTALKEGLQALVDGTLARWFTPGYLKTKPPDVERIRRQFLATPVAGYVGCTEAIRRLDYLEQLARIKVSTLIIVGEDDPGTPVSASRAMHERIAGSKLVIIPSAMHLCNIERTEVFNSALAGFLQTP
jgi:3-oxoadipate enol-lactonase